MKNDQPKLESTLVGVAGEYFVAAELSLRGHVASITLRNSRGMDILASSADGARRVSIQVKTSKGGRAIWIVNKKAESFVANDHFYVFVALHKAGERPSFHIVPSKVVANYTSTSHAKWLSGQKRDGSARKDSSMRVFRDHEGKYKEAWSTLRL
jgi:hypothetical protein